MDISLKGKTVLVCGSSQGIGLAAARELAANGANCILLARNPETLEKVVKNLPGGSDQFHSWKSVDFQDTDQLKRVVGQIADSHLVEVLINNSGGPKAGVLLEAGQEDFENAFRAHVIGNQIMVKALVPGMKKAGYGRIINIISTSVKTPLPGLGVSNTIRLAVASWAKTLANELGVFNITVNNVLPGLTETQRLTDLLGHTASSLKKDQNIIETMFKDSIPLKRFGKASEIANLIAFLASPAASYINGTNIPVDGGRTPAL